MTDEVWMTMPMSRRREIGVGGRIIKLPKQEHLLAEFLLLSRPRPKLVVDLVEYLWDADDEGAWPEWPVDTARQIICHLRGKGIPIKQRVRYGYTL